MYFDIEKQKVVWILKYKENDKETVENALSPLCFSSIDILIYIIICI